MKLKIKLVVLGYFPNVERIEGVKSWDSDLFEINSIGYCNISSRSDGYYWEYLDETVEKELPSTDGADILVAITNVPIQNGYFARRFSGNRICLSYAGMREILHYDNIPLENLLLRVLYSISLVYKTHGNRVPVMTENTSFTHDDTRGCIFDMDGNKTDILFNI